MFSEDLAAGATGPDGDEEVLIVTARAHFCANRNGQVASPAPGVADHYAGFLNLPADEQVL